MKPLNLTEIGFFGGKWRDERPADVVQAEMASRLGKGLPRLSKLSGRISWWNSVFSTYAHGLLRDDGASLRPLQQYWAFGGVTSRLVKGDEPVRASVEPQDHSTAVGRTTLITLRARNTTDASQNMRFWPVGFVEALGCTLEQIRANEWDGTLPPGREHRTRISACPRAAATGHSFAVGLAVVCEAGNSLALVDLSVEP